MDTVRYIERYAFDVSRRGFHWLTCYNAASSGELSSESLVLYAGLPVTAFVLLAIVIVVFVLLRRQFTWTTQGMLINYVNLCMGFRISPFPSCR